MFEIYRSWKAPRALKSFIIGYLILHLLAAVLFVSGLSRTVRRLMIDEAKHQMNEMAIMLSEHVKSLDKGVFDTKLPQHVENLGQSSQFRFTLIDHQGNVVADSETGTKDIGFHGDRPEVLAASFDQPGFSERYSATLQKNMMYLAIPHVTGEQNAVGHIRVATPSDPINGAIRSSQMYFWLFAIIIGVSTAFLMTVFATNIMKPLSIFSDAARRIGVGQYDLYPALLDRNDEWRSLADAFRNMQTELANREQRIVKNRDRLQAVLSSMIEGVVAIESHHKVLIANHAARRMLGMNEAELIGRNFLEIVRNPELSAAVEKTQTGRTFSKTDFQIVTDTSRRTISARVSVLPNEAQSDDQKPGVVIVLHDITELRQLENMRRDFVANVSHELKTPLASIKAYAETLRLGALNDKTRNIQFVEQIESQADFLNQQIQDLLQLARVESGNEVWDISPVDLNEACGNCKARFKELAQNRKIELNLQLSDAQPHARADAEGLATILNNLVTNALNYTPEGGTVTVATDYRGNSAVIEITDTGIGIAPEHHARIFERFYRVDKARSRDKGGTGLGLSIVKHLVQSFGGGVELKSEVGQGTTFRIQLPKYIA